MDDTNGDAEEIYVSGPADHRSIAGIRLHRDGNDNFFDEYHAVAVVHGAPVIVTAVDVFAC